MLFTCPGKVSTGIWYTRAPPRVSNCVTVMPFPSGVTVMPFPSCGYRTTRPAAGRAPAVAAPGTAPHSGRRRRRSWAMKRETAAVRWRPAPVDDGHRTHEARQRQLHRREGLDLALLLDRGRGQDADAGRDADGLLDGLDIVELHRHVHLDPVLLERPVDGAPDRQVMVEGHEPRAVEVGRTHAPPPRQRVARVRHHHHGLLAQRQHRERAARRRDRTGCRGRPRR